VVLRPLDFRAVELDDDGMLGAWQALSRSGTIDHCIAQLQASGNLDNFRRLVGSSTADYRGFWFADSDIYKVLEAVGWETGRAGDAGWEAFTGSTIELLRSAQEPDGYLNSWIQGVHPDRRWATLEHSHEFYCLGHLVQAAIALSRAAGNDLLLSVARDFADLVVREFGPDGAEGIDGHPEAESALVELYRHTGERDHLTLATRMVELRGRGLLGPGRFGVRYLQDHAPVREATEATGHVVSQLYLAAGVTDVYIETGDETLLAAMEKLWHSVYDEKTYVTGAHGSRHRDEAFGDPYELPPDRAYGETCAAIASFMWNWRLLLATGHGRYAEAMERALYNAIAVATAVDGCHFFYSNPLHLRAGHDGSHEDAASERLSWYACSCCPPNLARLIASLHHYGHQRRPRRPAAPAHGRARSGGTGHAGRHDGLPVGRPRRDRRRGPGRRVGACAADPRLVSAGHRHRGWRSAGRGPRRPRLPAPAARLGRLVDGRPRARDARPPHRCPPARRCGARLRCPRPRAARLLRRAGRSRWRGG
jgi:uncharacterized protein